MRPACARLGMRPPLGSRVDVSTGRFDGLNCHDEEKVRRLREAFPGARVEEFFSDSRADAPLAAIAERAWAVRGEEVEPWPEEWRRG